MFLFYIKDVINANQNRNDILIKLLAYSNDY
jgi:hypothetical protein